MTTINTVPFPNGRWSPLNLAENGLHGRLTELASSPTATPSMNAN